MRTSILFVFIIGSVFILNGISCYSEKPEVVTADELKGWINYLASDEMRGRANGSPEMISVSMWLSQKFEEFGLKPILKSGNYTQDYSFTSRGREINERNVIGMIEGTNPMLKDQFIILSAHFDHIGVRAGNSADSIYNGADDNAAGTSTLLGIAKTIKETGLRPGRSIIFASFSGEELGMRGSRHFVANPPVPMEDIYVNINFEMTGHSEYLGKNRYYMTGCKISDLDDLISEYNKKSDWVLIDTIAVANNLFRASDNIAFSMMSVSEGVSTGISSGTFATTAIADYIHSPGDEGRLFDYENMAGLVEHFSNLIIWLSESNYDVQFTDASYTGLN